MPPTRTRIPWKPPTHGWSQARPLSMPSAREAASPGFYELVLGGSRVKAGRRRRSGGVWAARE